MALLLALLMFIAMLVALLAGGQLITFREVGEGEDLSYVALVTHALLAAEVFYASSLLSQDLVRKEHKEHQTNPLESW